MNEQEASVLMGTAIVGPVLLKFSDADFKLIMDNANTTLRAAIVHVFAEPAAEVIGLVKDPLLAHHAVGALRAAADSGHRIYWIPVSFIADSYARETGPSGTVQ